MNAGKILAIVVAMISHWVVIGVSSQALAQGDTWATKASMPNAVAAPAAGAIGGKLYVVGGAPGGCTASDALAVYDPSTNMWESKASLPEPRHSGGAGVINGKLYSVGGSFNPCVDPGNARLYEYNPGTNMWARKADMPTPRIGVGVAVIDGKLYALGGQNGGGALNTLEMYDPGTNAWTTKASFPTGITNPAVGVVNGKLYVAGGLEFCCTSLATLRVYDPATNAWASKASLPSGRNQAAGGVMNGIFYVAGGINATGTDNTNTLFAYDPATDLWTTKAPMSTARGFPAAATINGQPGQLYVVGGGAVGVGPLSSLEVYTPPTAECVAPPSDLVSWWDGDAVSGTTAFDIRGGNDGTMAGGVNIVPGLVGNGFSFDGVDDFMNVGQPLSLTEGTVDFWVNRQGLTAESDVFIGSVDLLAALSANRAPTLFVQSSGTLLWEFGNVGQDTGKALPVGEWHHLAMTWKQNPDSSHSVVVYLDGTNVASGTPTAVTGFTDLLVGAYNYPNPVDQFAKAIIDELEVYSRALSAAEIQAMFNAGSAGKCKPVIIAATDPNAAEAGPDPGVFTFTRTGDTINALTVNFTVGGTATPATDYSSIGTSVTIPSGQTTATVTITPIFDALFEGNETVTLTLASGTGYTVGSPNTATVTIADYAGGLLRGMSQVNFGSVRVGSSVNRPLVISNGSTTETLVVRVNSPSPPFSLVSGGGTVVIGPGLSQGVTLKFTAPSPAGTTTGTLLINSSDPAKPTASVTLVGTGR